jgi:hypothetical protein
MSAVADLCLMCIRDLLTWDFGTVPSIADVFWNSEPELENEFRHYYHRFYSEKEGIEVVRSKPAKHYDIFFNKMMERLRPWLAKRGRRRTCPHVAGTCDTLVCCWGTERVLA